MTTDHAARARRPDPTSMIVRSPEDVLALVPVVFGFEPSESMVMLTFGADPPFHARVDLPARSAIPEMAAMLAEPARRHGAPHALLVVYSQRGRFADRALQATARALADSGIEVIDALRADGRRWFPVPVRGTPSMAIPAIGVPYDLSAHRFAAQAVYDGRVLHTSREELARSIAAVPDLVARVVPELAALGPQAPALDEGQWARELVVRHTEAATRPDDGAVARLLRGMLDVRVRDAACSSLCRDRARSHVELWTDVVRRAPDPLVPAPSAVLALAAWQAGDGALAWCAVDRCCEVEPDYSLAQLVGDLLTRAVAPQSWAGIGDWTQGMGPGIGPGMPPPGVG